MRIAMAKQDRRNRDIIKDMNDREVRMRDVNMGLREEIETYKRKAQGQERKKQEEEEICRYPYCLKNCGKAHLGEGRRERENKINRERPEVKVKKQEITVEQLKETDSICKYYLTDECKNMEECRYAHLIDIRDIVRKIKEKGV